MATLQTRFGALGVYTLGYLSFIYVPVLLLPLFSFNDSSFIAFPLRGFTLEWYRQMTESKGLLQALENSLKVGAVVSVLSTVLGVLAAKAVTRYRIRGGRPALGFIMLPLVMPSIIMGIALLTVANLGGVPLSLFTIGAGHMLVCVPFATLVMSSRLEGFDRTMEEAARDLGEGAWMTFWRVTFPLAMPGIVASLLLTFTISFDEFVLSFFLAGTDATLPLYIYSQLRFPASLPAVLALGACILMASFVVVTFSEWVRRRGVQLETSAGV